MVVDAILIAALIGGGLVAVHGDEHRRIILFSMMGALSLLISRNMRRVRLTRLDDVSDREFMERYGEVFRDPEEHVPATRREIARILGVPVGKLHAIHKVEEVAASGGVFGSEIVALSNLEDELRAAEERAGRTYERPVTIAEVVHRLVTAREVGERQS